MSQSRPDSNHLDLYTHGGGELYLSNDGQLTLLMSVLERGASMRMIARGNSMHPFIKDRDILQIVPLKNRLLCVGDVVAFKHPESGHLIIHRIIDQSGDEWLIRGDNSENNDGVIKCDEIFGLVSRVERAGKIVTLGMGKERRIVAWLSRNNLLLDFKLFYRLPIAVSIRVLSIAQTTNMYRRFGNKLLKGIQIAEAGQHDLDIVIRHFYPQHLYGRKAQEPKVINWVARHKHKIVGFIQLVERQLNLAEYTYWLYSFEIWHLYRGLGIDEMLAQHAIDHARIKGATKLWLYVNNDNPTAIKLYRKLGFELLKPEIVEQIHIINQLSIDEHQIMMYKKLD